MKGVVNGKVTSKLFKHTTPMAVGFIESRGSDTAHVHVSKTHILSVHDHDVSHHNNAPMIHVFFFFPYIHFFMFHISMSSLLLFSLHGSLIQPLWLQSILIRCSTHLMFSKKHPYWMVLMPVYVETAEGLVKPLVILPAAVMPLTSFILVFSRHHCPLYSCWFTPFSQPTTPLLYLTNHSHAPYRLCLSIVSLHLTTFGNTFYMWQDNIVRDSSEPLSYLI